MSPLGRGLASLIPRRRRNEAEELLEEIDEAPAEALAQAGEPDETPEAVQVKVEKEDEVFAEAAEPNEFEELANDTTEALPMPSKPNVTPLTLDEASGTLVVAGKRAKRKVKKEAVAVVEKDDFLERRVLGENVKYVALKDIEVNPQQPRRDFDEGDLAELMQSMEQHGILQPMVVMEKEDGKGYQIIAGERRWRAALKLGWSEAPCVVRSGVTGDKNRLELALTENVQRENLNPIEEAVGYKRLNEEYGMSHEEIGERVGKSRVAITNVIRVLQLPAEVQKGLIDEKITMGHARAILMIPDADKKVRFYEHVVDEGLTVRKTEIRARNIQRSMNAINPMASRSSGRREFGGQYEAMLQNFYGYNAKVRFNAPRNRFEVRFYAHSEKECDELINLLLRHKELPKNVDADVLED